MREHPDLPASLLDALPDPVFLVDAALVLRAANAACTRSLGFEREDWVGRSVLELLHPDDLGLALSRTTGLQGVPLEVRVMGADGMWRRWELLATRIEEGFAAGGLLVACRDLSRRYELEVAGSDLGLLRAIVNHSSSMIVIIEEDGTIRSVNGAVTRHLGYIPDQTVGTHFSSWIAPSQRDWISQAVGGLDGVNSFTIDGLMVHADGSEVLVEFTVTNLVNDPTVQGYIASGQVADSLRVARQRAEFLASHDAATGLLNRPGFYSAAAPLEQRSARTGQPFGVVLVDIDRLSQINGLYGAEVGDAVLQSVALRLQGLVRADDVVARYDGDEFAVLSALPLDGLISVRDRIVTSVAEPILYDGHDLRITVSTAVAVSNGNVPLRQLVEQCEAELGSAKGIAGEAARVPGTSMHERRRIVDELQVALDREELRLWFQPIVDREGVPLGFEALLRWHHPVRGVLSPALFLPLVGLAGLAARIDQLVADQCFTFVEELARLGRTDLTVHMNVTPRQIGQAGFAARIVDACAATGAPMSQLCLEITEADLLQVSAEALDNLARLRATGVHIAIDDFGTGFSSLAHLLELPVDVLKIDKRFVHGIGNDSMATNLVSVIVALTRNMGMGCVAEGVEQVHQLDHLVGLGCEQLQGWLFDAAMPASVALAKVRSGVTSSWV